MAQGKFITFEGGEGAGKTTQAERIKDTLEQAAGYEAVVTREPGGTFGAEAIRDLVLSGTHDRWSGMTELLLMYASRLDHTEKLIRPALKRGAWVLCDRFSDSSLAYQGYARGLGTDCVQTVHDTVMNGFEPDLTFLFDIDPIIAQNRVRNRGQGLSRFDSEDLVFHKTLREAFLKIAENNKDRFHVIDAESSRNAITRQIQHVMLSRFEELSFG